MKFRDYLDQFDKNNSDLKTIDNSFYENLGVKSFCSKAKTKDTKGNWSEEYIRARFVYAMVNSGMYPKENICVEFSFPKGNTKGTLNPDLVVFKNEDWQKDFKNKNYKIIRKNLLLIGETKKDNKSVLNAIEKQLRPAMQENESKDKVFGIYFDNQDDVLLYEKQSNNPITRFDINISTSGFSSKEDIIHRDSITKFPSFNDFINYNKGLLDKIEHKKIEEYTLQDLAPISNEKFDTIITDLKIIYDKIQPSIEKNALIVEALTLKVFDEKRLLSNISEKKTIEVYYSENKSLLVFRKEIQKIYKKAKDKYSNILGNYLLKYKKDNKPQEPKTENFIIEAIKLFQGYAILKSENDDFNQIIFNNFANEKQVAEKGQFFTPIPAVKAIVKMVNTKIDETLCDPCCGISDFLAMSFVNATRGKVVNDNISNFYGFDIGEENLKLAELNLVLNGDGGATLKGMDSLKNKYSVNGEIIKEDIFTNEKYDIKTWENLEDDELNPMKYDVILTNPPFGKGRPAKIPSYLKEAQAELYETWRGKTKKPPSTMDMGVLFLENAYKLLNKGGRLGIVLSNSIASIKDWENTRKWLMNKMRIVALFDLPSDTFGKTGVSTTVIIAYKPKDNEKEKLLNADYEVFIKEIKNIGYEWKTKNRARINSKVEIINEETFEKTGEILEDFSEMQEEFVEFMKRQEKEIKKAFHYDGDK